MSSSNRVVSFALFACVPLILSLCSAVGEGAPFGLGLLSNFLDAGNGTSLLAELALAKIDHEVDSLSAPADFVGLIANLTGTALVG